MKVYGGSQGYMKVCEGSRGYMWALHESPRGCKWVGEDKGTHELLTMSLVRQIRVRIRIQVRPLTMPHMLGPHRNPTSVCSVI